MSDVAKNIVNRPGPAPTYPSSHPAAPPDRPASLGGIRPSSPTPPRQNPLYTENPAYSDNGGRDHF